MLFLNKRRRCCKIESVVEQNNHHYIAPIGYEKDLIAEISHLKTLSIVGTEGPHIWVKGPRTHLWWAQWQLWNLKTKHIESISQATKFLKSQGKYWLNLDFKLHRRSSLIQEGLPKVKFPEIKRGPLSKVPECGAWFLVEANQLCFTHDISLNWPNGIIPIPADKAAPSRAFQKLDEVFIRIGKYPKKSERVIDLGSHPGGWTWVLSHYAGQVVSVDTVALDKKIEHLKNVSFLKKDAFKLLPHDVGAVDWLFSDIICEPTRLLELVKEWMRGGLVKNFVCTIKFKGAVDFNVLTMFQSIPNSEIMHLNANKHELTWVCLKRD